MLSEFFIFFRAFSQAAAFFRAFRRFRCRRFQLDGCFSRYFQAED
jgi:hypothetical protein